MNLTNLRKEDNSSNGHCRIAQREELTEQAIVLTAIAGRQVSVMHLMMQALLTICLGKETLRMNMQGRDEQH